MGKRISAGRPPVPVFRAKTNRGPESVVAYLVRQVNSGRRAWAGEALERGGDGRG